MYNRDRICQVATCSLMVDFNGGTEEISLQHCTRANWVILEELRNCSTIEYHNRTTNRIRSAGRTRDMRSTAHTSSARKARMTISQAIPRCNAAGSTCGDCSVRFAARPRAVPSIELVFALCQQLLDTRDILGLSPAARSGRM